MVRDPIPVLQFITPVGLHGAEMWILALARHFDPETVRCELVVTRESDVQNIEIVDRFRALGLTAHILPLGGRFDPRSIQRLRRLIQARGILLLHSHGYKSDILGFAAARATGRKILSTPHGFENAPDRKLQCFIWMGCQALPWFDGVAPLSEELARDMRRIGVPDKKIRLIQNGVDLGEADEARWRDGAEGEKAEPPVIGYVGQLISRKNLPDMIRAFEMLHVRRPATQLWIVGDGPERPRLESLAAKTKAAGAIRFLGYRSDRLNLIRRMRVFSMTSSLEGIPRCMMEAMALEVPVAAFQIPGVDQLIDDGRTGLSAPFGDVAALARRWEALLADPALAAALARNGRNHVVRRFSAERMARDYERLYRQMLAG
jgi:glycosyltransferase involved in cell wall biosynthesis